MLRFWSFVVLLTFTLIGYSQSTLRITSPASIAGDIAITKGLLGNGFVDTIKGELVFANNGAGSSLACDTIMNNVVIMSLVLQDLYLVCQILRSPFHV